MMFKKSPPYLADSPAFTLKYPPRGASNGGLRVVVSSKLTKKATVRNLLKRRMRHLWREVGGDLPAPHVYVKRAALSLKFEELKAELIKAVSKLR